MFDFQSDLDEKKLKVCKEVDPVLYESNAPSFYVVVDHPLPQPILTKLVKFITNITKTINFRIISALPFQPREKDLERAIVDLYTQHGTDLKKYIPEWSNVVTIGRGIYNILKSDDLSIEGFYDTIQWKTSFFTPELKATVYPCPNHFLWLEKDTFERYFTLHQFDFALKNKPKKLRIPKPELVDFKTEEEIAKFLESRIDYTGITSFDLETKGLDPWSKKGKIICLTLSFDDEVNKAYFLPFNLIDIPLLGKFFKKKKLIGNNIKYDIKWLRVKAQIPRDCLNLFWDNMKSSHAINEIQYNSLKSDAWLYTPYGGYDLPLSLYQERYPACKDDYSLIPHDILQPYATMDALVSLDCYRAHQKEIDDLDRLCKLDNGWSIRRALTDISFPAIATFTDIEINGMCYDWEKLKVLSKELQEEIAKRKIEIYKLLNIPSTVNISSGDQLGKFLESKGWEDPGRSVKKIYLTNEAAMLYWKKKGHKEVVQLQEYTECETVLKTFVGLEKNEKGKPTGYFQYRADDNKIHGTFRVSMADSWRGKSGDPNLQNVIKNSTVKLNGVPLHVRVRECFCVPGNDWVISENDGSGLQLHIAASYSQDPVMVDLFCNKGGDMHSITGRAVFCPDVPIEEFLKNKKEYPYKLYRKKAKAANFGLLFGASSRTFASASLVPEWTYDEAKEYVATYHLEKLQKQFLEKLLKQSPYANNKKEAGTIVGDEKTFNEDQVVFSYYWAAAEDIRTKFFNTYKGLAEWHTSQHSFGKKHGYVQSIWGPIRRVPFLTHVGKDDDGMRTKNYENICLNSPVQNFENCYMMYNMVRVNQDLHDNNMQTNMIGNIHDSFIAYLLRSEMDKDKEIFLNRFHEPLPEVMKGIPYEIELGYSDYTKGEVWGITEHEF